MNNSSRCLSALLTRGCSILVQLVLLALPSLIIESPHAALGASPKIVISEFIPRGANGPADDDEDEFVELYLSSVPVNIGDWLLKGSSNSTDAQGESPALECGLFRRSVKNGEDADAPVVDLSQPVPTTLSTMRAWPAPPSFPAANRLAPHETTVWVVNAILTKYRRASDQDYHLDLRDAAGNEITAEIPCPCCIDPRAPLTSLIAAARSNFDSLFTVTGSSQTTNITVRVAGVGMFDFPHNQTGAAPNFIELHPVIGITFNVDLNAPLIVSAAMRGKKLFVAGFNFDDGTVVLVDGDKQKTRNDEENPGMRLIAKKAGNFISPGHTVTLQVRKSDGTESESFSFTRPTQ